MLALIADQPRLWGLSAATAKELTSIAKLREAPRPLRQMVLADLQQASRAPEPRPSAVEVRLGFLAEALRLDKAESDVLRLIVSATRIREMNSLLAFGCVSALDEANVGALVLLVSSGSRKVREALSAKGTLQGLGLIEDRHGGDFAPSPTLMKLVQSRWAKPEDLLKKLYGVPKPPQFKAADFDHIGPSVDLAIRLVSVALQKGEPGVHVLIHGKPGGGKTELARTIVAAVSQAARFGAAPLFIGEEGAAGDEPSRSSRLASLAIADAAAARTGAAVIVVDEAEEIVGDLDGLTPWRRVEGGSRVFIHRIFEQTRTPTIWITNFPERFPESVLSRFSMAIHVPPLDAARRKDMVGRLVTRRGMRRLGTAGIDQLASLAASPRAIDSALRVGRLVKGGAADVALAARTVLEACGGDRQSSPKPPTVFDPTLSNADTDLEALAARLAASSSRAVTLALTGVPGAGKSAYARHLAERMGLQVVEKRPNDLFGKYVGETERRIAEAFREAGDQGAMLIFDEADSYVQDRSKAMRSHEVSCVNTFLTCLEAANHPVVLTTNCPLNTLDPALARRMVFKIAFHAMTPDQARALWRETFRTNPPKGLDRIDALTPGDFAVVKRAMNVLGDNMPPEEILARIEAEVGQKPDAPRRIGF
jgi:transitional endoplasmic reticulum ATPase